MGRNFGFEAKQDERDRVQFWTGFIAGGVSAAFTLCMIVLYLVWKYPV